MPFEQSVLLITRDGKLFLKRNLVPVPVTFR